MNNRYRRKQVVEAKYAPKVETTLAKDLFVKLLEKNEVRGMAWGSWTGKEMSANAALNMMEDCGRAIARAYDGFLAFTQEIRGEKPDSERTALEVAELYLKLNPQLKDSSDLLTVGGSWRVCSRVWKELNERSAKKAS